MLRLRVFTAAFLVLFNCTAAHSSSEPSNLPGFPPHVMQVVLNECVLCHSEPLASFGGLDMNHWVDTPDGRPAFVHLDADRKQRTSRESFQIILDRVLMSPKLEEHMPLGNTLDPSEELEPFVAWLNERISESRAELSENSH